MTDDNKPQLIRGLTFTDTTALVIGTVIGSGVFLKTAVMTQEVGTPALVLAAWVAAGLLSLAGALSYAELGAMLPSAGGEYVYLRQSYGEAAAFLFGWQRFFFSRSANWSHLRAPSGTPAWSGWALFGTAMLAALWAYDGWNNMPMAAGEVQEPGRNIPRALVGGMLVVMAIYCLANLAYFYALPVEEVLTSNSTRHRAALPVASRAAVTFLGEYGGKLVAVAFVVSALGALNGSILSNARVPYAMARDGLFFSRMANLSAGARVPVFAVVIQAIWSSVLAVSGTFDQLTDCLLFASWIFYGLVTSSVFVLRRKLPDLARPYRTLGYPLVPLAFVLVSSWLIVNTFIEKRVESVTGIVLILLGLPLYWYFRRAQGEAAA